MNTTLSTQQALNLKKEISELSTVFTAKQFCAFVEVTGEDSEGRTFTVSFVLDNSDPEFKKMVNDYGARKAALLL